jgi:uncharacterized membrane protein|tara:strand:+ start:946 stop:1137 length:192 start_codon:yes stop_codon:yes gene_type:complete
MGECIMETLGIIVVMVVALVLGYGSILIVLDKQAEWEARRDYDAMKEEYEKGEQNDASTERDT